MLRKLASVEARYEELNRSLADPAVASDQNKLRDLSKEHADIEKLVLAYRDYTKLQADLEGAKEMAEGETDLDLVEMAKAELSELSQQSTEMEQALRILLLPKDPNDGKNVILEIRAGTGGDESALFVGELFSMYASFGNPRGWRISILSSSEGSKGGFKEIIASIEGTDVYSTMKFESGVHRVQRVPATESQGRIHTSAVTVAVLPEAEEVDLKIADNELRFDVYRSSGPGGQSVNTTDSAVRITHLPTGLVVTCQDEKSQHKNKAKGLKVLRARLLDKMEAEVHAERSAERKSLVKSGDRSDKIRTYNFPQDRLTDHRIGLTLHNLPGILGGSLEEISNALIAHFQSEALKGEGL